MVQLHESFYLLKPLEERWGRWVLFKCTCPDFFGGGCCANSTLMGLPYDASLQFPSKYSSKQLQGRGAGKSKRPSEWAKIDEEEEDEAQRAEHWAPRQLSAGDMTIT
jgi:hypothetical protein